jgi:TonB family protein
MNALTKLAITAAALTLGLAANPIQPAAAAHSGRPNWAVVRVSVSNRGDIEGMRIMYQSGDKPFDRSALQAVSKTTFASSSKAATASTFDYALTTDARGKRAARIMAPFPGDAKVSQATTIAVRGTNPWTSGDVVACGI